MLRPVVSFVSEVSGFTGAAINKCVKGLVGARFFAEVSSTNIANQGDESYVDRQATFYSTPNGLEIGSLLLDSDAYYMSYEPANVLADQQGYVRKRKDKTLQNTVNMLSATQYYQANTSAIGAHVKMNQAGMKIGEQ